MRRSAFGCGAACVRLSLHLLDWKDDPMSTENPYEPSGVPPKDLGGLGGDAGLAASKVSGPAIALIVVGVINVLLALWGLFNNTRAIIAGPGAIEAQMTEQQRQQMDQLKSQGFDPQMIMKFAQAGGAVGLVFNVIQVAAAAVIIIGAQKMKNLQSRGMAMSASIVAMIPCVSSCCLIGLPIGIWALVTLNDPNVRASFTA
jgi:hypothetical protein